jgi:hypothetical protein
VAHPSPDEATGAGSAKDGNTISWSSPSDPCWSRGQSTTSAGRTGAGYRGRPPAAWGPP